MPTVDHDLVILNSLQQISNVDQLAEAVLDEPAADRCSAICMRHAGSWIACLRSRSDDCGRPFPTCTCCSAVKRSRTSLPMARTQHLNRAQPDAERADDEEAYAAKGEAAC